MKLMGIVNATPDSFSDGGAYDPVAHGLRLLAEGADVLDVGGESTRPGAVPVPEEEELRRVLPVVRALVGAGGLVSVDTRHARVAAHALAAGARWVNDVSGGEDEDMFGVCASEAATLVIMHMRGSPSTMRYLATYHDVSAEVWMHLGDRALMARAAGVAEVWLDPGIGFAKTAEQSLTLLRGLRGRDNARVLVGASRKSFLAALGDQPTPADRLEGSLAVAIHCREAGVGMIRVHDVAATRRALATWDALG
ncbi:dihydropteroate synthase [Deltaproteobacteria bacterium]|nr:dihydropteroate synthase [Deltaproteobacteria bacterium]